MESLFLVFPLNDYVAAGRRRPQAGRDGLLQGLQIAQRLLQGPDLPAVLGEVAGL